MAMYLSCAGGSRMCVESNHVGLLCCVQIPLTVRCVRLSTGSRLDGPLGCVCLRVRSCWRFTVCGVSLMPVICSEARSRQQCLYLPFAGRLLRCGAAIVELCDNHSYTGSATSTTTCHC